MVGGTATWANPENTTRPIRVLPSCACTNSRTAAWAAVSRLGSTSVAHIEPDTSSATITAAPATGTSSRACGRAPATPSDASAPSTSTKGRCRRHAERAGAAARINATLE